VIGRRFDPVAVTSAAELLDYLDSLRTVVVCPDETVAAAAREAVDRTATPGLFEVRVDASCPAGTAYLVRNIAGDGGPR
jgi:hypothetical protein